MKNSNKVILWLITFIMMFGGINTFGQSATNDTKQRERKYVKVSVDGLACPFCAYGLEKKLKNLQDAQDIKIEIQGGYATFHVPENSEVTREKLNTIVENAGFKARKITFSDQPFEKEKS